ncbi:uncharacterized protein LOC144246782 [Lonchura striata]
MGHLLKVVATPLDRTQPHLEAASMVGRVHLPQEAARLVDRVDVIVLGEVLVDPLVQSEVIPLQMTHLHLEAASTTARIHIPLDLASMEDMSHLLMEAASMVDNVHLPQEAANMVDR